ncbi:MAG: hypothetical protein CM1200mP20_04400 [Pseudomonadota bacterium]|nr:MAG: hypothetical protein CM1200mP20_04400 [Pseudomonadota bacterium]
MTPAMVISVPTMIRVVMVSPRNRMAVKAANSGEVAARVDATVTPARFIDSSVK